MASVLGRVTMQCVVGVLLTVVVAPVSQGDDRLSDFQDAIKHGEGCRSIPYSDRQDACERKQNEVNKWCKESGEFNCSRVDPKKLQADIEKLKTERDVLKTEKIGWNARTRR